MPDLSWRAILVGAAVTLVLAVPAGLLALALDDVSDRGDDSGATLALTLVILLAVVFGSTIAAWKRLDAPLSHGLVAAVVAFTPVQLIGIVRRLVDGDDIGWAGVFFAAAVVAVAGLSGGLVADRLARRRS